MLVLLWVIRTMEQELWEALSGNSTARSLSLLRIRSRRKRSWQDGSTSCLPYGRRLRPYLMFLKNTCILFPHSRDQLVDIFFTTQESLWGISLWWGRGFWIQVQHICQDMKR